MDYDPDEIDRLLHADNEIRRYVKDLVVQLPALAKNIDLTGNWRLKVASIFRNYLEEKKAVTPELQDWARAYAELEFHKGWEDISYIGAILVGTIVNEFYCYFISFDAPDRYRAWKIAPLWKVDTNWENCNLEDYEILGPAVIGSEEDDEETDEEADDVLDVFLQFDRSMVLMPYV